MQDGRWCCWNTNLGIFQETENRNRKIENRKTENRKSGEAGVARWKMELLEHKPWYFSGNRKTGKQENGNRKTGENRKSGRTGVARWNTNLGIFQETKYMLSSDWLVLIAVLLLVS